jgi:quercetin dioxygenase-like cupin family protein
MQIADVQGRSEEWVIGPDEGASRLFVWAVTIDQGHTVGLHYHHGEELFRVLYGRLRFCVDGDIREVRAGEIVIVPERKVHGYRALEASELELYGLIGCGVFIPAPSSDGADGEVESFVRGMPWTRTPPDDGHYVTRLEQMAAFPAWPWD